MRNNLPRGGPHHFETGIINLDDLQGSGTHWTAYRKRKNTIFWFDSFGDLPPPREVVSYFSGNQILYNYDNFQKFGSINCGHLCLKFLFNVIRPKIWKNINY